MKKLLVVLCIGLINNAMFALSPIRTWQCRPSNPRQDCSPAEKDAAKRTFITASTTTLGALAAFLAAVGISVGVKQLQKEKSEATKPMSEQEKFEQAGRKVQEAKRQLEEFQQQQYMSVPR